MVATVEQAALALLAAQVVAYITIQHIPQEAELLTKVLLAVALLLDHLIIMLAVAVALEQLVHFLMAVMVFKLPLSPLQQEQAPIVVITLVVVLVQQTLELAVQVD